MPRIAHVVLLALVSQLPVGLFAASHREAPAITETPKLDNTDLYVFRSYEPGRENFVTMIANFSPFQEPGGGPNFFSFDPDAFYDIHIDNDGDAEEDITYRLQFNNILRNLTVPTPTGDREVPLAVVGPISTPEDPNLNVVERYEMSVILGDRDTGTSFPVMRSTGENFFIKPFDNAGTKTIPDYPGYTSQHIFDFDLPTSPGGVGRVFAGQREESFFIDLGSTFDSLNFSDIAGGNPDTNPNTLKNFNISTIAIEVPIGSLLKDEGAGSTPDPVIGVWTTASLRQFTVPGPPKQLSRLGNALVNELIIGLKDKDTFNCSEPKDDSQFIDYVLFPTLPPLLEILFGDIGFQAPTRQRDDLAAAFLVGFAGLNQPQSPIPGDMLRLNTVIDPTPRESQNNLGAIEGDLAGFPNGRRPGDDVTDIVLRVAAGALLPPLEAPSGHFPLGDGVTRTANDFQDVFPYLNTPIPGAPRQQSTDCVIFSGFGTR